MNTLQEPTFSVRRPGNTAWATGLTRAQAEREQELANRTCAPGHEICPEDPEPDPSDGLFDALWYGEHDGEAFDGDPADIW